MVTDGLFLSGGIVLGSLVLLLVAPGDGMGCIDDPGTSVAMA